DVPPPLPPEETSREAPVGTGTPAASGVKGACVNLEVVWPDEILKGMPFVYEIVVRNPGSAPAYLTRVEETLPPGLQCLDVDPPARRQGDSLVWDLGTLDAGLERRIKIQVKPGAKGERTSSARASFAASCPSQPRDTQPQLTLTANGPESVQLG